ncbi:MAG: UDP-N-acetylmuramate--L-alanine ligase, partial [Demequinaceae bacterium]|nr:UDP-N-acetylmuramate--L-alanine ligase [Demequinaceae bacterium]
MARDSGRVHFIGVGGAGMSAVAYLLSRRGVSVSGSDGADGPYLRALAEAGIEVEVGHDSSAIDGATEVIVSSAIRESNPELAAARAAGIPVIHRSEGLLRAVEGMRLIAVAGAHGKTTTAAMAVRALHGAGIDATFAIGAPVFGGVGAVGGAYAGESNVAVIEADESDGSFLAYEPEVAIITNVEADHLDHYGTLEALEDAFVAFAGRARLLVACADDEGAGRVVTRIRGSEVAVVTYGSGTAADVILDERGVERDGFRTPIRIPQPGWHNRLNAAAAWTAAVALGADGGMAAKGLSSYAGAGRRFEHRGTEDGVEVYDDYAHHPTEIVALLKAARAHASGRLVLLFQPHLYSRTRLLAERFAAALTVPDADVIVTGIYGAREEPEPGVSGDTIGRLVTPPEGGTFRVIEDLDEAALEAARLAKTGGMVLTVGAGSVTDAADRILEELRVREAG